MQQHQQPPAKKRKSTAVDSSMPEPTPLVSIITSTAASSSSPPSTVAAAAVGPLASIVKAFQSDPAYRQLEHWNRVRTALAFQIDEAKAKKDGLDKVIQPAAAALYTRALALDAQRRGLDVASLALGSKIHEQVERCIKFETAIPIDHFIAAADFDVEKTQQPPIVVKFEPAAAKPSQDVKLGLDCCKACGSLRRKEAKDADKDVRRLIVYLVRDMSNNTSLARVCFGLDQIRSNAQHILDKSVCVVEFDGGICHVCAAVVALRSLEAPSLAALLMSNEGIPAKKVLFDRFFSAPGFAGYTPFENLHKPYLQTIGLDYF